MILAGLASNAAVAHRQGVEPASESRSHAETRGQGGVSLDAAVQMVQQRYKARVVRAETRQENGRTVYVLRLLNTDGKVWTVRVDADSGAVL
ncbi:MAG TPA: PepSY domain-containing protein [Steroidobacteraceae bacterium]|nr:PepSY domain-containing protein [Steroidobacteraceae bacterium]